MSIKWAFVQTDWDQIIKPNQNIMQYIRRLKDFWKTSKKISNTMQVFSELKKQNKKVSKKFMARTGTGWVKYIRLAILIFLFKSTIKMNLWHDSLEVSGDQTNIDNGLMIGLTVWPCLRIELQVSSNSCCKCQVN